MSVPDYGCCPKCQSAWVSGGDLEWVTLVGFVSPPGHNHDDNCRTRAFRCRNGHSFTLSIRNVCHACNWTGKDRCFCHDGLKLGQWPTVDVSRSRSRGDRHKEQRDESEKKSDVESCHEIEWDINREEGEFASVEAGLMLVPTAWSLNDKRVRRAVIDAVVEEFRAWLEVSLPTE